MLDRSCFGLDLGLYCGRIWKGEGRRTIGCAPAKPRSTAVSGAWEAVVAAALAANARISAAMLATSCSCRIVCAKLAKTAIARGR